MTITEFLASKEKAHAVKLVLIYLSLPMCQTLFQTPQKIKKTSVVHIIIITHIINKVTDAQTH